MYPARVFALFFPVFWLLPNVLYHFTNSCGSSLSFLLQTAIFLMAVSSTRPTSHRILSSALRRTSAIPLKYCTHLCIWQTLVICLLLAGNNMVPRCMMGKIQPNGRTGTETHADVHYNHVEFWLCGVKWRACVCVWGSYSVTQGEWGVISGQYYSTLQRWQL